jgi:hypothetical protein
VAIAPLFSALYDANVELLLSGHDHDYERLAPSDPNDAGDPVRGIRQFVVGTGGKNLRGFGTIDSQSEVRSSSVHGVLELTLPAGGYEWRFVPESGGVSVDSGVASCH